MQNQNLQSWSWGQGTVDHFPGAQSVPPTVFTPTGVDQNSFLPNYQQIYESSRAQPTADYSQWTSAQFQQWQQWQQWQEKYQQWQAQYGKKYAESLAAIGRNPNLLVPGFSPAVLPVKVPKPVEPVLGVSNPPLPSNSQLVPPPPPEEEKPPLPVKDVNAGLKHDPKDNCEELSQAEKTFDVQFKQWESDFEEWKKRNQDHPDKAQYAEYEKKWEAWREQLLQRLEQMRKKRLEKGNEANKKDDVKGKQTQGKPTDTDYGYRTQPQGGFEPPKFETKPSFFDKPPPVDQFGGSPYSQDRNISLDTEPSRAAFSENQIFQRNRIPFGNFEGSSMEENSDLRFRNSGSFGNFDNFLRRFEVRNFGPPARFPGDCFRNEREFNHGEKPPFGNDNRQPPNTKVPSLFDIQVEKPSELMGDWKPRPWEKHDDFEKKQHDGKSWQGNPWHKNVSSPWMHPWEKEKFSGQKSQPLGRDGSPSAHSPWLKDSPFKRDLDRVELSGYVGNILAKLGNVVPPPLGNRLNDLEMSDNREKKNGEEMEKRNGQNQTNLLGNSPIAGSDDRGIDDSVLPNNGDMDIDDRISDKFRRDGRRDERGWRNQFFERGPFGKAPIDDRGFDGKFLREDVDERFGGARISRRGFDRFDRDERFDEFVRHDQLNEPVWKPQVFDYSQGRPVRLDPDDGLKISTVVDYSHGENKQTFDYGHGEGGKNRFEVKSFDYGHKTEAPTVIDYGHGVDSSKVDKNRDGDGIEDGSKGVSDIQSVIKRPRSPRRSLRSRSRSPFSRIKRNSVSPPFKNVASRNRDRLGRETLRNDKNCPEDKLYSSDGGVSKHFTITTVLVEDLICRPGRDSRPSKLVFIMRGLPGSGKTYVTKLIKDKEVELGGDPPRILSLDDYFMTEVEKEIIDSETGRKLKIKTLEYEYEAAVEPHYRGSLVKAFKKTVSDGFFSFIIVDLVNERTKDYEEMWSFAKQKGFQVYIAEMDNDVTVCTGRNIHKRTEKEISDLAKAWEETPVHYLRLDVRSLLQADAITEVEMEVVSDTELEKSIGKECEETKDNGEVEKEEEEEDEPGVSAFVKSRWDQFENSEQNLVNWSLALVVLVREKHDKPQPLYTRFALLPVTGVFRSIWESLQQPELQMLANSSGQKRPRSPYYRLDGLKRRREGCHTTMEDYLQLPDDFDQEIVDFAPGKKKVRWADLEERKQQEKMRAIGFVVGQTDWSRMTDPTFGESALTRTKYI